MSMKKEYHYDNKREIMEWHYQMISEKCYHADLGYFDTYGILLTGPNHKEIIHDISVCEKTVTRMTELFNRSQLPPCHFQEVVENLIP